MRARAGDGWVDECEARSVGESTMEQRDEHRKRAEDAHRHSFEAAAQLGARWQSDEGTTRVERVIIGGGLAATLTWATQAPTKGTCLVLARAEEPWWSRSMHRLGQPASELVSEGFVLQPHDFADDVDGFAPASALADAIAVTAYQHGMPLVLGCCVDRPIEPTGDGRFAVQVGDHRIEAERVDVAVGPGPARRLRDAEERATIVSEEHEHLLLSDGRMVFGQDQWLWPVRLPRVLVLGGGATAAWNVELARQKGAEVTWVAEVGRAKHLDRLRHKAEAIEAYIEGHPNLEAERLRWLEQTWARIAAFRTADLPRNREIFRMRGVEWWAGSVERLWPHENGIAVAMRRAGHDGREELLFDQVVVSIGQHDRATEASAALVARMRMTWMESDRNESRAASLDDRPAGRIVGACEVGKSPRLRCMGVLLRSPSWRDKLRRSGLRRSNAIVALEMRLQRQADSAPRHSQGIDGAVFQIGANVVLANDGSLDPSLGKERYELLTSTFGAGVAQTDVATSSGEGG